MSHGYFEKRKIFSKVIFEVIQFEVTYFLSDISLKWLILNLPIFRTDLFLQIMDQLWHISEVIPIRSVTFSKWSSSKWPLVTHFRRELSLKMTYFRSDPLLVWPFLEVINFVAINFPKLLIFEMLNFLMARFRRNYFSKWLNLEVTNFRSNQFSK